ncbi:nucleotidyltransferase family protein [Methanobrevibacter oralis]|uniref:protein adenylyltransferase n=1 Tax=Methanobrevibacter oralis TaxID=66851 RepID=A0A166CGF5_METOA|nr:nucleotidyltransferase domain-containing protein [Methanobrevibacter oralis]KZX14077.1 nucleotidyltransferase domain protein [Methanobrevibacter oralis]
MIYTIEEIKEKTIPIAKKYGIDSMSLFGSYARGEATENSDVDFYIDKGDIKGLLDYIGFVQDLEDIFNCHVDVVSTGIQDKTFLALIKKDGVLIYEKQ